MSKGETCRKRTSSDKYRYNWDRIFGIRGRTVEYVYIDECSGIDIDEITANQVYVQKTPGEEIQVNGVKAKKSP